MRKITPHTPARLGSIALSMLLLAGAAVAQTTGGSISEGPAASGAMHGGAKVAHVDSAFMKHAAQSGNAEVEASKLALTKSSNPEIKSFAQQMIDDHTKAGDELKALATAKGVEVSDKPSLAQSAKIKLLDAMSGASFDKRYASMIGVNAHEDAVKLFKKESSGGKDADTRAWATKTLPTLQHHLEMAEALKTATTSTSTASK